MSFLEMENGIFKDGAHCYAELRLSATIIRTFGCYFKAHRSWTQGH